MIAVAATSNVEIQRFGTEQWGRLQWGLPAQAHIVASIMLGIEQAKKNQGTLLEDADLATDDDD